MLPAPCSACGKTIAPTDQRVFIAISTFDAGVLIALQQDHYHEACARPKPKG